MDFIDSPLLKETVQGFPTAFNEDAEASRLLKDRKSHRRGRRLPANTSLGKVQDRFRHQTLSRNLRLFPPDWRQILCNVSVTNICIPEFLAGRR